MAYLLQINPTYLTLRSTWFDASKDVSIFLKRISNLRVSQDLENTFSLKPASQLAQQVWIMEEVERMKKDAKWILSFLLRIQEAHNPIYLSGSDMASYQPIQEYLSGVRSNIDTPRECLNTQGSVKFIMQKNYPRTPVHLQAPWTAQALLVELDILYRLQRIVSRGRSPASTPSPATASSDHSHRKEVTLLVISYTHLATIYSNENAWRVPKKGRVLGQDWPVTMLTVIGNNALKLLGEKSPSHEALYNKCLENAWAMEMRLLTEIKRAYKMLHILVETMSKDLAARRKQKTNAIIKTRSSWMIKILGDGELNPGLPRDRRGYSPLYYHR
ncbi:hypothetical protein BJ684DRAFT_14895 [Piptocephalis cylindrospora]|uniref:Uncharacterized protein n=1 Tax=Piptocephalis cylindrospora TaxID=1907219 RepID=A0A4P9Y7R4_9FUNG|nr:hypothetical protein BJ684DRAFT_14895 [Piptocephalis cylindrospora]|eukprot:RKP14794.1 hypothetical protein BJ684DRAFT_14895 [Piptocephalis cylindrospora]